MRWRVLHPAARRSWIKSSGQLEIARDMPAFMVGGLVKLDKGMQGRGPMHALQGM